MKENRTAIVKLRLTEAEKKSAVKRAKDEGSTLSSYIRKSITGEKIVSKADIQIAFELKKIGNNLNQLAKHVNTLPADEIIRASINDIENYIKQLKKITDTLV